MKKLEPGWLKRQVELAEQDIKKWPAWLKQDYSKPKCNCVDAHNFNCPEAPL